MLPRFSFLQGRLQLSRKFCECLLIFSAAFLPSLLPRGRMNSAPLEGSGSPRNLKSKFRSLFGRRVFDETH